MAAPPARSVASIFSEIAGDPSVAKLMQSEPNYRSVTIGVYVARVAKQIDRERRASSDNNTVLLEQLIEQAMELNKLFLAQLGVPSEHIAEIAQQFGPQIRDCIFTPNTAEQATPALS